MLQHTLIAGVTGSGKSYLETQIIIPKLIESGADLILIDPKMVELVDFRKQALMYANNDSAAHDAVSFAYDLMMQRFGKMADEGVKESNERPLYLIVDEMAALMADKKHAKSYSTYFSKIALLGRSAHVFLILCTQAPTRKNLPEGVKDNVNWRVMLRQEDTSRYVYVLGKGANDLAPLPLYGEAYVMTPKMIAPRRMTVDGKLYDVLAE
jgi:DNA segregation ATPase FtsK/SpoIIIE-like protein